MQSYQLLPPLRDSEYEALKADIAEHGVQYPIVVDEHGAVLDGHHRMRICQELGISPPIEVRAGLTDDEKHDLALSLNLQRRHLSHLEKRELIRAEIELNADRSNRSIARLLAVDHKTVGAVRSEVLAEPVLNAAHVLLELAEAKVREADFVPLPRLTAEELDPADRLRLDPLQIRICVTLLNTTRALILMCRVAVWCGVPAVLGLSAHAWLTRGLGMTDDDTDESPHQVWAKWIRDEALDGLAA
jgi:hypothetical protein